MIMSAGLWAAFHAATKAMLIGILSASPLIIGGNKRRRIGDIRTHRILRRIENNIDAPLAITEIVKNGNDEYTVMAQSEKISDESRILLVIFANGSDHDRLLILDAGKSMDVEEIQNWAVWGLSLRIGVMRGIKDSAERPP